jgi:hypothetical protein
MKRKQELDSSSWIEYIYILSRKKTSSRIKKIFKKPEKRKIYIGIPSMMCITNDDAISNGITCNNVMKKRKEMMKKL